MSEASGLSDTIIPRSDQINGDDLLTGPQTHEISGVKRGSTNEQPLEVHLRGVEGRPWRPCKTMRRVLIAAYGDDGKEWVGKRITLYCDPEVKFGGVKVGGIRISHMSHIERDIELMLTSTRGRKESIRIRKLGAPAPAANWVDSYSDAIANATSMDELKAAFTAGTDEAKRRKDKGALELLTGVKNMRKAMLETETAPAVDSEPVQEDVF